jgi:tripartite-type tricarboxylate transporter receptor subunit TctC
MIRFLVIILAGALLMHSTAQSNPDYPNKPVRIIVNVAPGGGVDTATRIIADKLRVRLGQPFVVENRPGAGGNIGAEVVFQSEGDGYTLLASSPTPLAINGWLYKKLNFDPAGFEPVAMMSRIPNVLVVRPDFPAKSVQEVVAVAKATPGKFTFGSQGIGTASHLTGELFMTLTGTKLVHVPYKGNTSNVLTDVVAGHVDLSFIQFSAVHELQQSGKLRVLAVATDKRMEALPDVPTMAEAGFPRRRVGNVERDQRSAEDSRPDCSQAQHGDQRGAAGTGSPGALARSAGIGGRRRRGPDEEVRRGAAGALGQGHRSCQRAAAMNHRHGAARSR